VKEPNEFGLPGKQNIHKNYTLDLYPLCKEKLDQLKALEGNHLGERSILCLCGGFVACEE
jgi:hypothetical protein